MRIAVSIIDMKPRMLYMVSFLLPALSLLAFAGCSEREVVFVVDADEIMSYIESSPEAKELFRTDGLVPSTPYDVPHQAAVYLDRVLSLERTISVEMIPLWRIDPNNPKDSVRRDDSELIADYGTLGKFREAWAVVNDDFLIETTRIFVADTVVDTTSRRLTRYGFFLKLGDDSRPFVGWTLWGFRGKTTALGPLQTTVTALQGGDTASFTGDGDVVFYSDQPRSRSGFVPNRWFIKLADIPRVDNGTPMGLITDWVGTGSTTKRDYPLVCFDSQAGPAVVALGKSTRERYIGSVDLRDGSQNRYDFLFLQSFHDDEFFPTAAWVIPYQF